MIRSKLKKLLRSSRGFTMLEMIITVMITAIFFSCVVMILPTITKSYNKVISLNYARQIATSVSDAVAEQLTYAGNVKIDLTKEVLSYQYKGEQREIELNEKNKVIPGLSYASADDSNYYMGKSVVLEAELEPTPDGSKSKCRLNIMVYDKDEKLILQKERVIRLYGI